MCRALLLELGCLIAKKNHETREMHIYIQLCLSTVMFIKMKL